VNNDYPECVQIVDLLDDQSVVIQKTHFEFYANYFASLSLRLPPAADPVEAQFNVEREEDERRERTGDE